MLENVVLSFQSILAHKIRSLLTMLGIIIGIASIITIVSTIKGTNEQIKKNLIGSGVNAVVINLYQNDYQYDMQYQGNPEGVRLVTQDDLDEILKIDNVLAVSSFNKRNYSENVYYKDSAFNGSVFGIDENYFEIYGYCVQRGRGFLAEDYSKIRKIALIDDSAARNLFNNGDPIGQTLEINGEPFVIVGTVAQSSSFTPVINNINDYYMYMEQGGGNIFIPGTVWPVVYRFDEPQSVAVGTRSTDDMTSVGQKAAEYLTNNLITAESYSYRSQDLLERAKQLQELSSSTNRQLIWIAGISLIVGGIGVMNIMLVTVTERTREIGLKKAIGAKKSRILFQFLTEAAVLTSLGGVIGVITGIILAKILSYIMETPTAISVPAILVSVAFSMLIGILFGLIPAVKAGNLNPIDALRRE